MITLQPWRFGQPIPFHFITVKKPIGNFKEGETLHVNMMKMEGRIYKPGKDLEGKWLDTVGEPDKRIMVFDSTHYAAATKEELDNCFEEQL